MRRRILWPCLIVLAAAPAVACTTWRVPGDAPTIQAAVDSAGPGDVVLLARGTYLESDILLKSELTLRGVGCDPAAVVVDAQMQGRVLIVPADATGVRITGLTLAKGNAGEGADDAGGCLAVGHRAEVALRRCELVDGWGMIGGGASLDPDSRTTIRDCVLRRNAGPSHSRAGGLSVNAVASLEVVDTKFLSNRAGLNSGGAVRCRRSQAVRFEGCTFWNNRAGRYNGGAVDLDGGTTEFEDCRFLENYVQVGIGGALHCTGATLRMKGCLLFSNWADEGAGLFVELGSIVALESCTIVGNEAYYDGGTGYVGGIKAWQVVDLRIDRTIIAFNTGGAFEGTEPPVFSCCDIYGNPGGNWTRPIRDQVYVRGNMGTDPCFCDAEGGDYHLCADSPCATGRCPDECGRYIGAYGIGCGVCDCNVPLALEQRSWGTVKNLYR